MLTCVNVNIEHFEAGDDLKKFIKEQFNYIKSHLSGDANVEFFIGRQGRSRYKTIINVNYLNYNFSSHATGKTPFFSLSESRHKIMSQIRRKKKKIVQAQHRKHKEKQQNSA